MAGRHANKILQGVSIETTVAAQGAQTLSFYNFYPFGCAFLGSAPPDRAVHDYPTLPITKNREEV